MYDIYESDTADSARFILGNNGKKTLYVIGLNPSTANKERSDTTVAKVESVARRNGFDGFVMANLYPLRSTEPTALPERCDSELLKLNLDAIKRYAERESEPVFWAAWGGGILLRPYLVESLKLLGASVETLNGKWVAYGELRQDGHPRHPSRLSYSWTFSPFEFAHYLNKVV